MTQAGMPSAKSNDLVAEPEGQRGSSVPRWRSGSDSGGLLLDHVGVFQPDARVGLVADHDRAADLEGSLVGELAILQECAVGLALEVGSQEEDLAVRRKSETDKGLAHGGTAGQFLVAGPDTDGDFRPLALPLLFRLGLRRLARLDSEELLLSHDHRW